MSVLIDKLISEDRLNENQSEFEGKWFVAKPMPYYALLNFRRFIDAWRIIIGKSHAYHYKIDEL